MQYVPLPAAADSNYPYVLWQQELAGGAKKMITLLHSIVCTARFWMSFQCGKPFDHQEAVIPPQCILGTDAVTVTKADRKSAAAAGDPGGLWFLHVKRTVLHYVKLNRFFKYNVEHQYEHQPVPVLCPMVHDN